jgi:polysaccharide biosynthesis protein VpsQ
MKWLTVAFALFLITIIVLADMGFMRGKLRLLHSIPYGDKIGHFLLIGMLSFLLTSSLIQTLPSRDPKWIAVSAGLILGFIFTVEEASQGFIPGREASFKDLFANYAGILFFGFIAWILNGQRAS